MSEATLKKAVNALIKYVLERKDEINASVIDCEIKNDLSDILVNFIVEKDYKVMKFSVVISWHDFVNTHTWGEAFSIVKEKGEKIIKEINQAYR